ncbi:MAG: Unknown protein [uncultured Thiotrichaceae bacterium]|uniref:Uncharacterized protein n=1 Tax=uncultured Thiotrichaceae bacterium TaxID=298394 RepID=A0A6S6TAU7_9GAMM|nr:MAG: Unknown protein [uncultured Thiotrichaceae bacterium]
MFFVKFLIASVFCLLTMPALYADTDTLKRTVTLQPSDGDSIDIASIEFTKRKEGAYTYSIDFDDSKFGNHFLSMRPFKCFEGSKQMLCHLPYPYEKAKTISADDLQDLEYDLLFIHRKSTDYGIDPWNGVYYKLSLDKDATLTGVLKEVDLDILAAPPDEGVLRPITADQLNDADASSHSYPELIIQ